MVVTTVKQAMGELARINRERVLVQSSALSEPTKLRLLQELQGMQKALDDAVKSWK